MYVHAELPEQRLKYQAPVIDRSSWQYSFVDPDVRVCVAFGAKGSGKTYVGALWALQMMQRGGKGLIILNSFAQTRDIFLQNLKPWLDKLNWRYSYSGMSMNLEVMGSIVHLRSADKESIKKIESIEYEWGWADEASYYDAEALRIFVSRVRKGDAAIRITSMPDEPDAFVYSFCEEITREDGKLFEVSLKENPDKQFRERYEKLLRATYQGQQLKRYLEGSRVSLSGLGAFNVSATNLGDFPYDPDEPVVISWDFNVEYCAVSAWQQVGVDKSGRPVVACVRSWQLKEQTVYANAEMLLAEIGGHKNLVYLHGDASGANRTAISTDSMWKGVRDIFYRHFGGNLRYVVPDRNPMVRDTIQAFNWALGEQLVWIDRSEKHVYKSLVAARTDKYGDIDKKNDYKPDAIKSHDADTARYAIWHYFKGMYPGSSESYFVI